MEKGLQNAFRVKFLLVYSEHFPEIAVALGGGWAGGSLARSNQLPPSALPSSGDDHTIVVATHPSLFRDHVARIEPAGDDSDDSDDSDFKEDANSSRRRRSRSIGRRYWY